MMKIAGHTMGTPEYTLEEAIKLFKELEFDGIEIIIQQDGYQCAIPQEASLDYVREVKQMCDDVGLEVAQATPYLNLFNDLDESVRLKEVDALKRCVDMADVLGAKTIRIYGGKFLPDETDEDGAKLEALAKSMREVGDYCEGSGIRLALENHFSTMTTTAKETMRCINYIDHKNVGVLYDQANLAFFYPPEDYVEAIDLQKDKIFFVHCKDLVYRGGKPTPPKFTMVSHVNEEDRTVYSRVPGDGILDWPGILKKLKEDAGYDGWVSLEYERRWQPQDLPEAHDGMKRGRDLVKSILESLE